MLASPRLYLDLSNLWANLSLCKLWLKVYLHERHFQMPKMTAPASVHLKDWLIGLTLLTLAPWSLRQQIWLFYFIIIARTCTILPQPMDNVNTSLLYLSLFYKLTILWTYIYKNGSLHKQGSMKVNRYFFFLIWFIQIREKEEKAQSCNIRH